MKLKNINIGQSLAILANVGVLAGLILVAIELNQNTEQLTLELQWQINEQMIQNNRDFVGDSSSEIFEKLVTEPDDLTFAEFQAAAALLFNLLSVWEDRFFLYEAGLLEEENWKSYIDDDIGLTLGSRFAMAWWHETKGMFEPEFAHYVDERLKEIDTDASYQWYLNTMDRLSVD